MALLTFLSEQSEQGKQLSKRKRKLQKQKQPSSWDQIKNLLTCKQVEGSGVHDPSKNPNGYSKLGSSCSSICSFRDVVHGNTRVVHRADNSPESSTVGQETGLLSRKAANGSSTRSLGSSGRSSGGATYTSSSRGIQFRKLSGCYECHMIVDPSRSNSVTACNSKADTMSDLSELGPEDSSRNIVEIIFKSSWLKKDNSICKIERILKVHNTQRTIQRFEDSRDVVKTRALNSTKKTPGCGVCTIIRHGFEGKECKGVRTTASSGRAHDSLISCTDGRRAMLVCRVIAGRVKRVEDDTAPPEEDAASTGGSYDSVAGYAGIYSNLEELFVFNPKAILPCFVVIYSALES
ncbi:hypothetical protein GH714_016295 [Hevea brasiliensis]|uniref:PARP catalytic domain-containing protein n=1 Tax=Hevea brasiliensis TaxID=3981 RepID=A0A6A6NHS2_HEVBR|nr:hypothetical protein GH714_016295 [Hevea brasiliensis]